MASIFPLNYEQLEFYSLLQEALHNTKEFGKKFQRLHSATYSGDYATLELLLRQWFGITTFTWFNYLDFYFYIPNV